MTNEAPEYYGYRERAERAAAKSATCPQARRAHQELAQAYAALVDTSGSHKVSPARSR